MGSVTPLRVDERTIHQAAVRFLRSHDQDPAATSRFYQFLVDSKITDADGKPAIFKASPEQRRVIYAWLLENTSP